MTHILAILIFLFTIIGEIFSQSDFRNGYIINNNNDTIHGLIDYRGNKSNSEKCIFKKDNNSSQIIFSPLDLKGYRFIDSKFYVSKLINSKDGDKVIFIEFLINGLVDIYYYRDNVMDEHYLIDKGDGRLIILKNESKEYLVNDVKYIKDTKEYINILRYIFNDSPSTIKNLENIVLNHKSLINIAEIYNRDVCSNGECIIYEKKIPKVKLTFGALIELNALLLSIGNSIPDDFYYLKNSNFNYTIYPSIGIYINKKMSSINERLSFHYELSYSKRILNTKNSFIEPDYKMNFINNISVIQNALNNLGLVYYEFPKGKFRPVLQIGGFVNYNYLSSFSRDLEVKFYWDKTNYNEHYNNNPFSKFEYGLSLGVGIISKKINNRDIAINFRYQRGFGLIQYFKTNNLTVNLEIQLL